MIALKRLAVLVLLMWLTSFGYSQTISIIEGDTVVLVPIKRLQVATIKILQADSLRSEHVALRSQHEMLKSIVQSQTKLLGNKDKEIDLLTNVVKSESGKSNIYKSELKLRDKEVKKLKRQRLLIGAGFFVALIWR